MTRLLKQVYHFFSISLPTLFNSVVSGIKYDSTNKIVGHPVIISQGWLFKLYAKSKSGTLIIGHHFTCLNKVASNSIGLIQPCVFNIATSGSKIQIGNNVGISGSTINATTSITIGNNVLIGSGCIITDTDSHPLHYEDRNAERNEKTHRAPIVIEDNCFIGARSIILKGVTIGEGSVVGAGSVVSKDVPPHCVVCGNPAKVVKTLK